MAAEDQRRFDREIQEYISSLKSRDAQKESEKRARIPTQAAFFTTKRLKPSSTFSSSTSSRASDSGYNEASSSTSRPKRRHFAAMFRDYVARNKDALINDLPLLPQGKLKKKKVRLSILSQFTIRKLSWTGYAWHCQWPAPWDVTCLPTIPI